MSELPAPNSLNSTPQRWPARLRCGLFLALLVLCACCARLPGLERSLWYDELFTLRHFVDAPLHRALWKQKAANNHPLYSGLAWFSTRALPGRRELGLRLPALMLGLCIVLGLGLVFAVPCRGSPADAEAGLVAAALAVAAPALVEYSQEARGYGGCALGVLLTLRLGAGPGVATRRHLMALAAALIFALWMHLAGGLAILGLALVLSQRALWGAEDARLEARRRLMALGLGGFAALLLWSPILKRMSSFARRNLGVHEGGLGPRLTELWRGLLCWDGPPVAGALLLLLALLGLALARDQERELARSSAAAILLSLLFWSLPGTLFFPRFLVPLVPLVLLLAGLGCVALRRRFGALAYGFPMLLILLWIPSDVHRAGDQTQDLRGALRLAEDWAQGGGIIAGGRGAELLSHYAGREIPVVNELAALDRALAAGARIYIEPFEGHSLGAIKRRLAGFECRVLDGRRFRVRVFRLRRP